MKKNANLAGNKFDFSLTWLHSSKTPAQDILGTVINVLISVYRKYIYQTSFCKTM